MKDSDLNRMLYESGGINFTIVSIGDKETFKSKAGAPYEKQNIVLQIPATSEKITVQMFPKFVAYLQEGGMVRGQAGEKYPEWKFVEKGIQNESNQKQVKNERVATETVKVIDNERVIHDWKLGLAGIVQAMIIAGIDESKIMGETKPHEGTISAVEWATWIRSKAKEMAEKPDTSSLPF